MISAMCAIGRPAADERAVHRIAVLALPDVVAFDLATPFQLLRDHYELTLCATEPGPIQTTSDFPLVA